jgi:hypothetical protein
MFRNIMQYAFQQNFKEFIEAYLIDLAINYDTEVSGTAEEAYSSN